MLLIRRTPPPLGREALAAGRREICEARGYCGPFLNQALYDAFPGWAGHGDCVHCGSTVRVVDHAGARA